MGSSPKGNNSGSELFPLRAVPYSMENILSLKWPPLNVSIFLCTCVTCVMGTSQYFTPVFSGIYCWVLIFVSFHFYISISIYKEMIHRYVWDLSCEPNSYLSWSTSEIRVRFSSSNMFKLSVILLTAPNQRFICGSLLLFAFHGCRAVFSVPCSHVVTW